jgi:hypothetical protein
MSNATTDLWPEDLVVNVQTPAMILNEQAEALGKRTQGIVRSSTSDSYQGTLRSIDFELTAPVIGFRARLLQVRHEEERPYPCVVVAGALRDDPELEPEDADTWALTPAEFEQACEAESPDELRKLLRTVFNAPETKSMLFSLVARSNEVAAKAPAQTTES